MFSREFQVVGAEQRKARPEKEEEMACENAHFTSVMKETCQKNGKYSAKSFRKHPGHTEHSHQNKLHKC